MEMRITGDVRPIRVLALDGGGIKGAFSASVLATLEESTGKRCIDHFDLITGTSTGGIIAIGLGLGLTAAEIRDFYERRGPTIFPKVGVVGRRLETLKQLVRSKHASGVLRDELTDVFHDRTLGSSKVRLVIPSYDVTEGRVFLFKTRHDPLFTHDVDIPAVEIAMATAAAPTFFDAVTLAQHQHAHYVDGGVWANSPALVGLTEAVHFLGHAPEDVAILSIGTTNEPWSRSAKKAGAGVIGWGAQLIELLMASQVEGALAHAWLASGKGVHRIDVTVAPKRFRLDGSRQISELLALGRSAGAKEANITAVKTYFLNDDEAEPFVPAEAAP